MDIKKVLIEYDNMFGIHSLEEIEDFLTKKLDEAYGEEDYYSAVTLLNEIIGFCRDTSQNHKGSGYCRQVVELMDRLGLDGTIEYATTLLNVANAYRAFGMLDESLELYQNVERIYVEKLPKGDFNYASLYNNLSLLYQEMQEYDKARVTLERALRIVDKFPGAIMEQATTRTNLAVTLLRMKQMDDAEGDGELESDTESNTYYNMAMKYLGQALDIYERDGGRDFHYSAALSAMGDALYMHAEYENASKYYKKAMDELEKHVGKTEAYERVEENYDRAVRRFEMSLQQDINYNKPLKEERVESTDRISEYVHELTNNMPKFNNNMERCKAFYEEYGAPMIRDKFPEYESRIAVGLVGEGSDCFGFDDDVSKDHDYGVGFCMWLLDADFEKIGLLLHKEYERLVLMHEKEFYDRSDLGANIGEKAHMYIDSRRGVFTINDFYENLLGVRFSPRIDASCQNKTESDKVECEYLSVADMMSIDEDKLATAVNGEVFRDDYGVFSDVRSELEGYYPNKVWMLRLSEHLHIFSQNGQYNYARMMARKDYVTAKICVAQAIKSAMAIVYLLNKRYAPYYKWMRKGMNNLRILSGVVPLLDEISIMENQMSAWETGSYNPYENNMRDSVVASFEAVAVLILSELNRQKVVSGNDTFLDSHCRAIAKKAVSFSVEGDGIEQQGNVRGNRMNFDRDGIIEKIVLMEWQQFDKVKNEGGRADCQDDWNTFSLMRKSQYMAWTDELLKSYMKDLSDADSRGWNLIMEKYARMMEFTTPDKFVELKDELPVISEDRIAIQEEIIAIQVEWMEKFAEQYPKMAGNARSIHSYQDSPYNTSYETYLRGELGTYSKDTLLLYGRFIVGIKQKGENLAFNIMSNTAKLYGYKSVEEAESKL